MLLREETPIEDNPTTPTLDELVGEYQAWAEGLATQGRLAGANHLGTDTGLWLEGNDVSTTSAAVSWHISGYFVIRAQDLTDATNVARTAPHLKYGGAIELREIN